MNLAAVADVVALIAFGVAIAFVVALPSRTPGIGSHVKWSLFAAVGVYFAVSASNMLEHTGITAALDVYEDFAEVLFVPLVAAVLYSRAQAEQLARSRRAEADIRDNHELLMSIVDTTPAGILVADASGIVTFANRLATRMLARAVNGQLDLGAIVRSAPTSHPHVSLGLGEEMGYLSVRCTPLERSESGEQRAALILVDVTQRVRTEIELDEYRSGLERAIDLRTAELLEANRQLQDAGEAKQQFLARMSHELRTPLNSIIGFSDVMLKQLPGPLTDEQHLQLGIVKSSGVQLLGLVNDVLDMTRIEAGHTAVSPVRTDLGGRVRALVESMAAIASVRGVHLACECVADSWVTTDPDKLDQVLRNLISNAIKFTDSGGSVMAVVAAGDGYSTVTITDTGIGIAEGDMERIFEAFQQVNTPDRVRPEGTGLGLAISRELCGILGCELSVESSPGEGSVFTVRVPDEFR